MLLQSVGGSRPKSRAFDHKEAGAAAHSVHWASRAAISEAADNQGAPPCERAMTVAGISTIFSFLICDKQFSFTMSTCQGTGI